MKNHFTSSIQVLVGCMILFFLPPLFQEVNAQADASQEKMIKKELGASVIVWDTCNYDGVFVAQIKENKKWGMYQLNESSGKIKKLIMPKFDSLGFYCVSSNYLIVKDKGQYGVLNSPWNDSPAKLVIKCKHQELRYTENEMLASKQGGKWGYISPFNGDTLVPFEYTAFDELPAPNPRFLKSPMTSYPDKLKKVLSDPLSVTALDLSGLNLTYLPDKVGQCKNARSANLENNDLTELPESFYKLEKMESLFLGGNPSFIVFPAEFSGLIGLKELHIGAIKGSGRFKYSAYTSMEFSAEMGELKNLEKLFIQTYFTDGDWPAFIYELPNLKTLVITNTIVKTDFSKIDLSKMKSRQTLEFFALSNLNRMDQLNAQMKLFPNLKSVILKTYEVSTAPTFIFDLPNLEYFKLEEWVIDGEANSYRTKEIVLFSRWPDPVANKKDKEKLLQDWKKYFHEKK